MNRVYAKPSGFLPAALAACSLLALPVSTAPQSEPYCHFLGPVFPRPQSLSKSPAFELGLAQLKSTLEGLVEDDAFHSANTSAYIQVFSTEETLLDWSYVPEHEKQYLTSETLDEDTLFRIGSISKLVAVYALLAETGMKHVNDPVTEWVPELKTLAEDSDNGDSVEKFQWDEITVGSLANHLAGINQGMGLGDMVQGLELAGLDDAAIEALGLPVLSEGEKPLCGTAPGTDLSRCSRKDVFENLASFQPVTAPLKTPVYSNLGYDLLGFAMEGITGKSFSELVGKAVLEPLGLQRTFVSIPPNNDNAIIPGGEDASWWNVPMETSDPAGGLFSTAADLRVMGQSILSSTLLKQSTTNAWLKPSSFNFDIDVGVGMPWEIERMRSPRSPASSTQKRDDDNGSPSTRMVDIYTKGGGIGAYSTLIALSPDHGVGFVILSASSAGAGAAGVLSQMIPNAIASSIIPAADEAAREQAGQKLAGEYVRSSGNNGTESRIVLEVDDEAPGVKIAKWTRGDANLLETIGGFYFAPGVSASASLYSVGLQDGEKLAMRAIFQPDPVPDEAEGLEGVFMGKCAAWGTADSAKYGDVSFGDFKFDLDNEGNVVGVTPRVMRETLTKVA